MSEKKLSKEEWLATAKQYGTEAQEKYYLRRSSDAGRGITSIFDLKGSDPQLDKLLDAADGHFAEAYRSCAMAAAHLRVHLEPKKP